MRTLRTTKTMNPVTRFLLATVVLGLCLVAGPAWSAITAVSVAPASASIPLGQPASVTVVWTVTRDVATASTIGTVTSSQGRFLASDSGPYAARDASSVLSQPNVADLVPATIVESVLVPQDVAQRALKLGAATCFTYAPLWIRSAVRRGRHP